MDCRLCKYRDGGHADACPEQVKDDPILRRLYMAACNDGWEDGRTGKEARYEYPASFEARVAQKPAEATYLLGYLRGEAAAEEAENGCQSWAG